MGLKKSDQKIMTKILKSLANEKRLRILKLLLSGAEMNVSEISEELKLPFLTVSRHLEKLRSVDLVEFRQQGLRNYYSITDIDQAMVNDFLRIIQRYYKN